MLTVPAMGWNGCINNNFHKALSLRFTKVGWRLKTTTMKLPKIYCFSTIYTQKSCTRSTEWKLVIFVEDIQNLRYTWGTTLIETLFLVCGPWAECLYNSVDWMCCDVRLSGWENCAKETGLTWSFQIPEVVCRCLCFHGLIVSFINVKYHIFGYVRC